MCIASKPQSGGSVSEANIFLGVSMGQLEESIDEDFPEACGWVSWWSPQYSQQKSCPLNALGVSYLLLSQYLPFFHVAPDLVL